MEHVILSISGMTCTGCETKLVRILGTHPRVRNLKASLVLSRAEFDVTGAVSAAEVMKHLERTTEFKCERITNQGSSLDLIAPGGDAAAFVNQPWPGGVTEVRAVNKKTVNVSFDAKAIGARDLVKHGWGNAQLELAPLRPDPSLEAGSRHARHVGYTALLSVCLTIPVMTMAWAPLPKHDIAYASASLALATIVQFAIAGPFYPNRRPGVNKLCVCIQTLIDAPPSSSSLSNPSSPSSIKRDRLSWLTDDGPTLPLAEEST